MKTYLVKYRDNWADEMDVYGFAVLSEKAWNFFLSALDNAGEEYFEEFEIGVGSNESIPYESKEEMLTNFEVTEITEEEAAMLRKNFKLPYGQFPIDQILEGMIDEAEMGMGLDVSELESEQWFWDELNGQ